jgi:hypothetical protein
MRDSEFCAGHDPKWQERRKRTMETRELIRRGRQPRIVEGVFQLVPMMIEDLREGRISVQMASTVGQILQFVINALGKSQPFGKSATPAARKPQTQDRSRTDQGEKGAKCGEGETPGSVE